ncbi:MAG: hypothetical protein ABI567_00775 [Gammaproteobacteria bacterium]
MFLNAASIDLLVQACAILVAALLAAVFGAIIWDSGIQLWQAWRNSQDDHG